MYRVTWVVAEGGRERFMVYEHAKAATKAMSDLVDNMMGGFIFSVKIEFDKSPDRWHTS